MVTNLSVSRFHFQRSIEAMNGERKRNRVRQGEDEAWNKSWFRGSSVKSRLLERVQPKECRLAPIKEIKKSRIAKKE